MTTLTLELETPRSQGGHVATLHGDGVDTIRVQTETSTPTVDPKALDGQICSTIFYAMRNCRKLDVRGPVSEKFFRNISEFQEAWHCHFPDLYRKVDINPSELMPFESFQNLPNGNGMVQTYSGGVDSIFSLLRNGDRQDDSTASALLVHGFDVPYSNQSDFDDLRRRIEKVTDTSGVELKVLKTTHRDSLPTNWEHSQRTDAVALMALPENPNDPPRHKIDRN